jgi:hypothetical protein
MPVNAINTHRIRSCWNPGGGALGIVYSFVGNTEEGYFVESAIAISVGAFLLLMIYMISSR